MSMKNIMLYKKLSKNYNKEFDIISSAVQNKECSIKIMDYDGTHTAYIYVKLDLENYRKIFSIEDFSINSNTWISYYDGKVLIQSESISSFLAILKKLKVKISNTDFDKIKQCISDKCDSIERELNIINDMKSNNDYQEYESIEVGFHF